MKAQERSIRQAPPLQSGSFPLVTARTGRGLRILRSGGALLPLVAGAASAGYWFTLWSITGHTARAHDTQHASQPLLAASEGRSDTPAHVLDAARTSTASPAPAPLDPPSVQPLAPSPKRRRASTLAAKGVNQTSPWDAPAQLEASPVLPTQESPQLADLPVAAHQAEALPAVQRTPSRPSHVPQQAAAATPPATLAARADIEELVVRGSLPTAAVRRALERVHPQLDGCYARSARQAQHNQFGRVQLRLAFDERGRARRTHVSGGELPGLDQCIGTVAQRLVTSPPDTGIVDAELRIVFGPL